MASNQALNPFASKVLIVTVGADKARFNIHEALLLKTSFFEIHSEPNGESIEKQNDEPNPDTTFKKEGSSSTGTETPNPVADALDNPSTPTPTEEVKDISPVDYHLNKPHVKAFGIFVNYLYNSPPQEPTNPTQCKILIQAYLLAVRYNAGGLQNLLVDCIRRFHAEHQVNFDMLFIYLLNRHGDDEECKLIRYFVDQIAYEIAENGVEDFDKNNVGFTFFLRERKEGRAREALVHALGRLATVGKNGARLVDPAVAEKHDYYVPLA